jgi:site-specific recombinase XerD
VEKVDFKHDTVIIDAAFDLNRFRPSTKEDDIRYLPLLPEVREALQQLPRHLSGFVFINRHGRPLSASQVFVHWRRAAEKAGIKVTNYEGTRHSLASQAINRGVSERIVGDMLGHKTITSTRRYAKMRTETLRHMWGDETVSEPSLKAKVIKLTTRKKKDKWA